MKFLGPENKFEVSKYRVEKVLANKVRLYMRSNRIRMASCLMSIVGYQSKENFGLQLVGSKRRLRVAVAGEDVGVATTVSYLKYCVHFPVINSNTLSEARGTCSKLHRITLYYIICYIHAAWDHP